MILPPWFTEGVALPSAHTSAASVIHVIDAKVTRLEESPGVPRRHWPDAVKERLIAAASEPGVNVSALARAHGVTLQLLFAWRSRSRRKAAALAAAPPDDTFVTPAFADVAVIASAEGVGTVEIVVGAVLLRIGPDVPVDRVTALVRAVRQA